MKKGLSVLFAMVFAAFHVFAQQPEVTITVDQTTSTTITASFNKNDVCTSYYILADTEAGMSQWTTMFGVELEALVMQWGIQYTENASYTWIEMVPNTPYIVYVAALSDSDTVLYTAQAPTVSGGGEGVSQLTIIVSDIGDTNARVVVTPDENTALFKDMIIEKAVADTLSADTLIAWLQASQYTYYETDDWVWTSLDPNTCYYAVAMGQNALEEWGELAQVEFCTTGGGDDPTGIEDRVHDANITVYPNPATDVVNVAGLAAGTQVFLHNTLGRVISLQYSDGTNCTFNVSELPNGVYFLSTIVAGKVSSVKVMVQ